MTSVQQAADALDPVAAMQRAREQSHDPVTRLALAQAIAAVAWVTDRQPDAPVPEPWDYRTQSAPVLIQTTRGEFYVARWTVYEDKEFEPVWILAGADGWDLEPDKVAAWAPIRPYRAP